MAYRRRDRADNHRDRSRKLERHPNHRLLQLLGMEWDRNIGGGVMAHFALVDDTNTVREVIVIGNDDCGGGEFPESEPIGQTFIASIGLTGTWLQTSYHANFRSKYAGIGDLYVAESDEFVSPTTEA